MDLPRVLILNTSSEETNQIPPSIGAKHLLNQDSVDYYLWDIDNKYYSTQILLCSLENPQTQITADNVEALIVHHNPEKENAEKNLNQWLPLIHLVEAEVLLLSCVQFSDSSIRDKLSEWCIQNRFELVETSCNNTNGAMEFDLEHNKHGIERIIEALHAHTWPNMVIKHLPSDKSFNKEDSASVMNKVEEQLDHIHINQDVTESLKMESVLDGIMGGEDADFAELFGQLMAMREHAASLPTNQRRIAAEQLVTAVWKAMGGDLSEIED